MMTQSKITNVTKELKNSIEKKYKIYEMKLFGSSARGNFSKDSDIDVMVRLENIDRSIEEDIFNMAYDLELKYDCVIDIFVIPLTFSRSIPLFQNISVEGITI